jgi:hypothetical protein
MYIRKEIRDFIKKMPKEMKLPRHWKKFVNKQDEEFNLLIKHGNEYECTNCGKYFYSEQVEGCSDVCPFCNNQYKVKRGNLKNYFFLYDLAVIDNIDNKIVLRYFEVLRKYHYETRRFKDNVVEYARIIPELDIELANDRFVKYLATEKIWHTKNIKKWRVFTGMYGLPQYYKAVYTNNINEKVKGTKYQYSQIQEAIEYQQNKKKELLDIIRDNKVNVLYTLKKAENPSFELLMKAKLYKLALECPEEFNIKGSFEKRFGVKKEYYNFMEKNNISYDELRVLKLIDRPNISIIRRLLKLSNSNVDDLKKVSTYVNLIKVEEYSKKQKDFSITIYLDYIDNVKKLNVPLTKKILFPENLIQAHNDVLEKVDVIENKKTCEKIRKRYEKLKKNSYSNDVFFIRPANSLNDMRDEANQQKNCVYKNYSEKYANGDTDIYFLRKLDKPEKSLVTVEVTKNKIRQKYQKKNKVTTTEQNNFLKLWEKNIIQKAA